MYTNGNGYFYIGDMRTGDREATPEEIEAYEASRAPTYQQLRAAAYPPVTDGMDAMVKGGQAWEDYKAACLAIKAKIPKV